MQKPAEKPQKRGLFRRMRTWLHRGHPSSVPKPLSLVILPQRASLFSDRLLLSLPADFRAVKGSRRNSIYRFAGEKSGLRLTVMELPFSRKLQRVTSFDLQSAFRHILPRSPAPQITHGFLRHSPTLTAEWGVVRKTVLRLIQVRKTVYLLYFENVEPANADTADAVCYAASVAV